MGQGGSRELVLLAPGVILGVDHYGFGSIFPSCSLDLVFAYLLYLHSAEFEWSSMDYFPCWFPYGFADSQVCALVEAVIPLRKRYSSKVFGEDKASLARDIFWSYAWMDQ